LKRLKKYKVNGKNNLERLLKLRVNNYKIVFRRFLFKNNNSNNSNNKISEFKDDVLKSNK